MGLWEIFVLSVVRLGLDANYDRLEDFANYPQADTSDNGSRDVVWRRQEIFLSEYKGQCKFVGRGDP